MTKIISEFNSMFLAKYKVVGFLRVNIPENFLSISLICFFFFKSESNKEEAFFPNAPQPY